MCMKVILLSIFAMFQLFKKTPTQILQMDVVNMQVIMVNVKTCLRVTVDIPRHAMFHAAFV